MLGAVSLLGLSEPLLKAMALGQLAPDDPEALARLAHAADPAACPPRPLYLRAPDATPPSRLPGQPRQPVA